MKNIISIILGILMFLKLMELLYGAIFLDKPLNIINIIDDIKKLNVDIVVLEFTTETIENIKKVLKQLKTRKGEYREYNYKRGVY